MNSTDKSEVFARDSKTSTASPTATPTTARLSPAHTRLVLEPGQLYRELRAAIFLIAALFLLYRLAAPITAILLLFLLVFIMAAVLNPIVTRLQSWRIPRMIGALMVVASLVAIFIGVAWLALPPLLTELSNVSARIETTQTWAENLYKSVGQRFPQLKEHLPPPDKMFSNFRPEWGSMLRFMQTYTMTLAGALLSFLVCLVLLIYTLGNPEPLVAGLLAATPESWRARVETAVRRIMEQLKGWALGSLVVGCIVGVITGLGLHLMGVPYAFLFGVIAALGELVPNLGPILASAPPIMVALSVDPQKAIWVALFFLVLQQLESNILSPLILGKKLELHPVSLIFTMVVMHELYGLLGALLAVPVCAILKVCWMEFYLEPRAENTRLMEREVQQHAEDIVADPSGAQSA